MCPVQLSGPGEMRAHPALTFNGLNYLAVWARNNEPGYPDRSHLFGALVSPGLGIVRPEFQISTSSSSQRHAAVASKGTNYLVVWEDDRNRGTMGIDIYGAYVTKAGSVGIPQGFLINSRAGDQTLPQAVGIGNDNFVIWQDERKDIHVATVTSSAVLTPPTSFAINTDPFDQTKPQLAVNNSGQALVVYESTRFGPRHIEGNFAYPWPVITSSSYDPVTHTMMICWPSSPGRTYQVQSSASFPPNWTTACTTTASGPLTCCRFNAPGSQGYYRVVEP